MFALLSLLFACQEPFGTDRHDLEGVRIAAVRADVDGGDISPRAALVVDGQLWADERVSLAWFRVDDADALQQLSPIEPAHGVGPAPTFERRDTPYVGLIAQFGNGEERRALLQVSESPVSIEALDVAVVDGVDLLTVQPPELTADARAGWTTTAAAHVPEAGFARLSVSTDAELAPTSRWMAVGGSGSFFELDRSTTDWAAGELVVDGDEVVEQVAAEPGPSTILVLAVDGQGGSDFRAQELWIGPPSTGVVTHSGRWLGTDVPVEGELVRGVLEADDSAPTGLRLMSAEPAALPLPGFDPYGTESLCESVLGPFDPSWLLDGRCTRGDLLGETVVVQVQ